MTAAASPPGEMSELAAAGARQSLLLLAASKELGGGIERVVDAVCRAWDGPLMRIDMLAADRPHARPLVKARFAAQSVRVAGRRETDWVLCLHAGLLPVAVLAGRVARARVALFAYGTEVWSELGPTTRCTVRACDRRLAISQFTAASLARRAALPEGAVDVLPLPIDERFWRRAQAGAVGANREPVVLTVSRLVPEHRYKGYLDVADAWPRVLERRPDARWQVVGTGPDLEVLRARCRDLGIGASVELLGAIDDDTLAACYARASVLTLPSLTDIDAQPPTGEGFGLVYAEAGAFAVPSIASSASGGAADIVRDGETGLLVAPDNPGALADAMVRVLDDPALRRRLGEAARSKVQADHLPDAFQRRLRELLR